MVVYMKSQKLEHCFVRLLGISSMFLIDEWTFHLCFDWLLDISSTVWLGTEKIGFDWLLKFLPMLWVGMLAVFWLVMASWYYCWRVEFTSLPGGIIGSMFVFYSLGFQSASYVDVVRPCVCDCSKTLASEQRGWKKRQLPARCWSATLGNWKRHLRNTLKRLWRSWFLCSSFTSMMVSFGTWGTGWW